MARTTCTWPCVACVVAAQAAAVQGMTAVVVGVKSGHHACQAGARPTCCRAVGVVEQLRGVCLEALQPRLTAAGEED